MKTNDNKFTEAQQNDSPADFPLGSPESRARAREMAEAREAPGRIWEQQAMRRYEQLRDLAVAAGPGTDTPEWEAVKDFLAYCQTEAPRHGAHTPAYLEFMNAFELSKRLSVEVEEAGRTGKEVDPEDERFLSVWREVVAEWMEEIRADRSLPEDLRGYATPGKTPPLSQWKQEGSN